MRWESGRQALERGRHIEDEVAMSMEGKRPLIESENGTNGTNEETKRKIPIIVQFSFPSVQNVSICFLRDKNKTTRTSGIVAWLGSITKHDAHVRRSEAGGGGGACVYVSLFSSS